MRRVFLVTLIAVMALPILARGTTAALAQGRLFSDPQVAPARHVAVVFGAGVRNGQPSAVLFDRVASAVALYRAGKVDKLLMSGDNRFETYNEPGAMRRAALQLGVPDADIVLDYAGRSTYDTCYRARTIFGLRDAVLVTQGYHLDRALFTCRALGVDAVGLAANLRNYRGMIWFQFRELGATVNAFLELFVTRPTPVLGEGIEVG
jgi:vancomycin permeability regulator SanA